ncbi:MAG: Ig-like domain-containing protein, partial [Pyrinomonadaceae bacterium]
MRSIPRRLFNRVSARPFLIFAILLIGLSFVPVLRSGAAKLLGRVGAPVAVDPEPAAPFFAPGVTATKVATLGPAGPGGDENGNGKVNRGDTLIYTINIANAGVSPADDALSLLFNDTIDINTTLVAGSVNVSPLARDDSYATIGNTLLEVGVTPSGNVAVSVTNPATDSIFDNDAEFQGDSFTLKSVEAVNFVAVSVTAATEQGGSVTVEADGNFSYTPPVGFGGADAFDYVITDDGPDNILGNADDLTGPGRVTINVNAAKVWYVKNDAAAGGLGRSSDPFDTLLEAQTASAVGDTIYVFLGNGTTTGQNAGFVLKASQRLLGEGVALTVPVSVNGGPNPTTLRVAGTQPMIGNSAGVGVTATNVGAIEIRGLNVGATTDGIAFTVSNTGAATFTGEIGNNTVRATGAASAIFAGNLSNLASSGRVNIHDNVITSASVGIGLQRTSVSGTFFVTGFSGNSISGASTFGLSSSANTAFPIVFDANPATTAFDTVLAGNTVVGSAGDAVSLTGLAFDDVAGDISFTDVVVFAGAPRALFIDGPGSSFNAAAGTGFRMTANTGTGTLASTSGAAIEVFEANINIALASVASSNASVAASGAIGFIDVSGTFSSPAGTLTDPIGSGVFVSGNNVSTAVLSVSYGGTITDDVGFPVRVEDIPAAATTTVTLSGAVTDNNDGDGVEQGIRILNAAGATVTFRGGLLIRTTNNTAFSATGGGTVNVCDENPCNPAATGALVNTLTSTTGTALTVTSTTIGGNNLEFRSISSNGATNGIVLNATGSSGGLVVKGNSSGVCGGQVTVNALGTPATVTPPNTADCSGGTIQNSTADGVSLTSTANVSLTRMYVLSNANAGIRGTNLTNFSFVNSFASNNDNANAVALEAGLRFDNLLGACAVTNSTISGTKGDNIRIDNTSGTLSNLAISGSVIGANPVGTGANGLAALTHNSAAATIAVTNSVFTGNQAS